VLYRVPLGGAPGVSAIPLGGDFTFVPGAFNTNGIDATPDGKTLVIVHSTLGVLYTVDPATGVADQIDLSGGDVSSGDGILLDGKTLYVVQNFLNQVAVVSLAADLSAGVVVDVLTNPSFDIPTTIDEHGNRLYAVNARFSTPPTPTTEYSVVQFTK
jgi:sugar lactone lactonase YvrE